MVGLCYPPRPNQTKKNWLFLLLFSKPQAEKTTHKNHFVSKVCALKNRNVGTNIFTRSESNIKTETKAKKKKSKCDAKIFSDVTFHNIIKELYRYRSHNHIQKYHNHIRSFCIFENWMPKLCSCLHHSNIMSNAEKMTEVVFKLFATKHVCFS